MPPDHDHVRVALHHDLHAATLERLHDALATADQRGLSWLDEQRGGVGARQDIADGGDADRGERRLLGLDSSGGVVRDEQNTMSGRTQAHDRVHRARNRLVSQPDHTVEITEHGEHVWPCWHVRCQPVQVPRFEPFAALRYSPTLSLDEVTAPPYDVLSDDDVTELLSRHPRNIVAIDVPREVDGPDRYRKAAERLRDWIAEGTLVHDPTRSYTLYRMQFTDEAGVARHTVGVLGALEVVDEGAPGVLPHERTTPKAKSDRLDLTRSTNTNLSPVWGLSLTPGLTALLREPGEPMGSCRDEQGVIHTVERITEPERVAAIESAVASNPVLIADGHHRYAIARTFRDEVRAMNLTHGPAELTLAYVAELVDDQLSIDAIHRLYHGVTAEELLTRLSSAFSASEAGPVTPAFASELVARGALCLVRADGTGVWLTPRAEAFAGVRALDGAYLEHVLGTDAIDVSYQHGIRQVVDAVGSGTADAGVLIRPTSIEEIRRTAHERVLMPPKSTFFTPKLRTGPVLRPLT